MSRHLPLPARTPHVSTLERHLLDPAACPSPTGSSIYLSLPHFSTFVCSETTFASPLSKHLRRGAGLVTFVVTSSTSFLSFCFCFLLNLFFVFLQQSYSFDPSRNFPLTAFGFDCRSIRRYLGIEASAWLGTSALRYWQRAFDL